MSGSTTPATTSPGPRGGSMIGGGIIILAIFIASIILYFNHVTKPKLPEETSNPQTYDTYTPPTSPVKIGKEPTPYQYSESADQCVERNMTTHDFHWYLQGGKAMVYPPHGAEPFLDIPGKKVVTHIQPGVWKWCKADPDATGVEIWE